MTEIAFASPILHRVGREHLEAFLVTAGCHGRLRLLATIEDPATVSKFLAHLGTRPSLVPRRPRLQ